MRISERDYFSMRDIAKVLGVSYSMVKIKIRHELGAPLRIGRCLRWSRAQLETYIKNHVED